MTSFFLQGSQLLLTRSPRGDSTIRGWIPSVIDRHSYRRKYNAEQALADFAASARSETDLDALSSKLVELVSQTMQPEQVSLWLRKGKS